MGKSAKRYIRTLSTKGQVTIPAEVRKLLGIGLRGSVVFHVQNRQVELLPNTMTLEETFASVPPLKWPLGEEEMNEIIREGRVNRWLRISADVQQEKQT
jgi:AbrB family looped-hinge helix DNA binding protein